MSTYLHPLIDIGVNLSSKKLAQEPEAIIQRATNANVRGMILTGTSVEASIRCADYAKKLSTLSCSLWSTAGVHPHDAARALDRGDRWLSEIESLLSRPEVISVGECGLDFERNYSPQDIQLQVFEAQLQLAVKYQLPLFLHQRGAHKAFYELLQRYSAQLPKRDHRLAVVVHCFTGGIDELEAYLDLGCMIGITGWVCDERRGTALQEAVSSLPLDRVLVETDAPYLMPRTLRPRPKHGINEPAFLPHIVTELARWMRVDAQTLAFQATQNTCELFEIQLSMNGDHER